MKVFTLSSTKIVGKVVKIELRVKIKALTYTIKFDKINLIKLKV